MSALPSTDVLTQKRLENLGTPKMSETAAPSKGCLSCVNLVREEGRLFCIWLCSFLETKALEVFCDCEGFVAPNRTCAKESSSKHACPKAFDKKLIETALKLKAFKGSVIVERICCGKPGYHCQRARQSTLRRGKESLLFTVFRQSRTTPLSACRWRGLNMAVETQRKTVQTKMQHVLTRLNLPLTVNWIPDRNRNEHGVIESGTIFLFDESESEAWLTFEHEILEYRLKGVTDVYREMANSFIEAFERLAYKRKEQFLDSIPEIAKIIEASRKRWH